MLSQMWKVRGEFYPLYQIKEKKKRLYLASCGILFIIAVPKGLTLLVNSSYALTVLHSYLHRKIGHVSLAESIEKQMVECFEKNHGLPFLQSLYSAH